MKTNLQQTKPSPKEKATSKSSKDRETLEDIFAELLKDIYWAEKRLIKALPKMVKAAFNDTLKEALETHLEQTEGQLKRIEKCFELARMKPVAKKCEAMEGLVKEGESILQNHNPGHARDAAIIGAAQKIEHYEISAYGTLTTMATLLGKVQCAELLTETKDEETETDVKLTEIAEKINQAAVVMVEEPW